MTEKRTIGHARGKHVSGFTLLEIVIAISILSFALLGLAQLHIKAIQGNAFASRLTTASTLAQEKMEQLMRLSYDAIVDGNDVSGAYTRAWSIQTDSPVAGTKTVTVTVSSQGDSVQLSTVISNQS